MFKIVKESDESFNEFQNDWNDMINSIHQFEPKTNSGRILKGKLEKICYEYIKKLHDGE